MSWFKQGEEGEKFLQEEKERRQKQAEASNNIKNWRFKLAKDVTGQVVFLDDLYFFFSEHQFYANDSYYNYETCIDDIEGECPLCENGNRPSIVAVTTIIDFTQHKKKDGTFTDKPTKKPMVLKQGGTERLLKRQKKLGGLTYRKFEVYRSSDPKGEATGTDIDYEKEVDVEDLKKFAPEGVDPNEWIKPFDYAEMFQPKTAPELRKILGIPEPAGSDHEATNSEYGVETKDKLADLI